MSLLKEVAKRLDRLVAFTVIILITCMVVTTSAGVFWRYGLNSALSWSDELGRFLLVWVSFLGAALATYRGAHIGINVIFDMLPPRVQLWLGRIVDVMIIIFMGSILVNGMKILPAVHVRVAPTLCIHMSIPYFIMPVSAGIIIFQMLVHLLTGPDKRKAEK